ncbi:MAG: hypothetical protein WCF67_14210 [Chitinophagaceae bacterium]
MNRRKMAFAALIFAAAIGSAFASTKRAYQPGHVFDNSQPVGEKCVYKRDCSGGTVPCLQSGSGTPQLQRLSFGQQDVCNTPLYQL